VQSYLALVCCNYEVHGYQIECFFLLPLQKNRQALFFSKSIMKKNGVPAKASWLTFPIKDVTDIIGLLILRQR
tara:strand:- start:548 stop:766 length:219 start_codon:yes stop_codon:yes gene_type:complete